MLRKSLIQFSADGWGSVPSLLFCLTLKGKSDSVSCGHNAPFSWPWFSQGFVCALQQSVSPVLWKFCNQTHCLQSQIAWGFWVPLPDPQVEKSVVGPRTFLTLGEFLWYNHSATRWRSRRMCTHLLRELQNCNLLLNNCWLENVGSHQKKMSNVQRQRKSPNKMAEGEKSRLESNPPPTRDTRKAQTKPCAHQNPEVPQRLS